jgi:hypothetical protein
MAVEKKRKLKPGPAGKTAERAHYIRLMKQGPNNSEACRTVGVGRKTGSHWRNGRTVRDAATGRDRSYAAIPRVREQPAIISARYLSEEERITIAPSTWQRSPLASTTDHGKYLTTTRPQSALLGS